MKKNYYFLAILFAFNIAKAQNLVMNPGFETATVPFPNGTSLTPYPTVINDWSAVTADGEIIYDQTLPHSGTGFLSVLQNPGANPNTFWLGTSSAGGYDRAIQIISVLPSTSYQLQFWLRSGNNLRYSGYAAGTLLVQVEQVSPTNSVIDSFTVYTPLSWQQSNFGFTTGSTCTSIALLFSGYDPNGVDAWLDDIDLQAESNVAVTAINSEPSISIYPNPITDKLIIKSNYNEATEIILYDFLSRKILQQTYTNNTILNTEHLARGMYLYEVRNQKGIIKKGKINKE